ncbi:MAG: hypothetical protein ABIE23_02875, partial [archaeon]
AAGLLEGADLDTLDVYCTTEGDRLITLTTSWSVPGASDSETDNASFNVAPNLPPTVDAGGPYFGVINEDFNVSGYAFDPDGDAVNEIEWVNIPPECTLVGEIVSGIGTDYADNNAVINCSIRGAKQIKLRASDEFGHTGENTANVFISPEETNVIMVDNLKVNPLIRNGNVPLNVSASIINVTPLATNVTVRIYITDEEGNEKEIEETIELPIAGAGTEEVSHSFAADELDWGLNDIGNYFVVVEAVAAMDPPEEYLFDNERREAWTNAIKRKVAVTEANYLSVIIVLMAALMIIFYRKKANN